MKNYTSEVPVERTINRIEQILMNIGAANILKDYENGKLVSIKFAVIEPTTNKKIVIIIPANVAAVQRVFESEVIRRPTKQRLQRIEDQAARTAWKLMQEWLEIQLSLIEMNQVEILQVFLPYIFDGRQSFYAALKSNGFKLLTYSGKEE